MSGNLADLVRTAAASAPGKPALLFHGATLTWGELDGRIDEAANALRAHGLEPGDRVGLLLGNTPDFPVAYFGALRAGLVALPLNPGYTAAELAYAFSDSGARAVVTKGIQAGIHAGIQAGTVELPPGLAVLDPQALSGDATPVDAVGGGEDLAVLLYTSGTSGRPKGAMLSHRALIANLEQTAEIEPPVVGPDDVVLLVLPLFHIYGLNAALGLVAQQGATGVLVERFDPVQTLEEVRRHQVTNVVGAPPMYVAWSLLPDLEQAFSSVRVLVSGAAPLPGEVLQRVLDATGHHVFEGYGLTETAPVLTSTLMSPVPKASSIGRPIPGVEVRLVDLAGNDVEEGDPGEILARGANLFSGYWPDGAEGPDAEGWFATGDVAVLDGDGDLHLVDRRRELVLVSGFNVYPREVEDVLVRHPGIAEVAVLGTPHPYTGQSVKAIIVRSDPTLTVEAVIAHAALSLARFKCPTVVEFVPALPHTAIGKVSKGRLRELAG